ncbi:amidase [Aliiroseovarius sp.]|uniref:amidase n=1 Tax=Aliiroseovarius sp. TaxID=1872442 RepID=UPI003BAD2B92
MSANWLSMSMAELGRGIGAGQIDPVALARTYLDAIAASPVADRIYARVTADRALAEAGAAKRRADAGQRLGLLDGVPVSWKDLFDTAGVATEAGSALLADRVPTRDARVLANATAAGLVCLGKTHMSELAFSGLGVNPITATPPCVNDPGAAPGGSSSGAAASVAFNLAPCGIGSDTGGSVRIPSAWNDLVGFKTSHGRLSCEGVVPLVASFDTVGPLCRSVEDAALVLGVLEGGTVPDLRGATLQGRRLLVLKNGLDDTRNGPGTGFEQAVKRLEAAGASVAQQRLTCIDEALSLSGVLFTTEAYATWRDQIEAQPDLMFGEIRERFRSGKQFSGVEFISAWQRLRMLRAEYHQRTAGFDAVLLPTSPILPPNIERLETDSDYYVTENLLALRNTRVGNLMGSAGLSLPTGVPSAGLMMLTPPGSDHRLLRLGAAAERALA